MLHQIDQKSTQCPLLKPNKQKQRWPPLRKPAKVAVDKNGVTFSGNGTDAYSNACPVVFNKVKDGYIVELEIVLTKAVPPVSATIDVSFFYSVFIFTV